MVGTGVSPPWHTMAISGIPGRQDGIFCGIDDQPKTGILPLGLWDADSQSLRAFCSG